MPVPSVKISTIDTTLQAFKSQKRKVFYAGYFTRGATNKITPVYSVQDLITKFGYPDSKNYHDWFMIYNYFQYNNNEIILSRIVGENSINSSVSYPFTDKPVKIDNLEIFNILKPDLIDDKNFIRIIARTPGSWGNNLKVCLFTQTEILNNNRIFNNIYAKDIQKILKSSEYCLCVFDGNDLVEKIIFENIDVVNNNSNYIYIIFDYKKYKLFDGNTAYIDGNKILVDGNEPNVIRPVFYGYNALALKGGELDYPDESLVEETYLNIGDSNELIIDFILANSRNPNAAIKLADIKSDCCAFIGIPRNVNIFDYTEKLIKSNNAIVYLGQKQQINPYTGQKMFISFIGDILGLRTFLINNNELSSSHCKSDYNLLNTLQADKYFSNEEVSRLYDNNINVCRRSNYGIHAFSENMLKGDKLTNRIIYFNLVRDCEQVTRYFLFEHNDEVTRHDLKKKLNAICESYKASNNIDNYKVICDISNNPNPDNNLYADVYYKSKFLVEEIRIKLQLSINI